MNYLHFFQNSYAYNKLKTKIIDTCNILSNFFPTKLFQPLRLDK